MPNPALKKMTPVVVVDRIEPLLPFYVDRLGFNKVVEVPHDNHIGFVMLVKGTIELMFQSVASVKADMKNDSAQAAKASLYFEVENLDDVAEAIEGAPIVVPRRQTFYGMDEFFVSDPAGNVIGFAKPMAQG